MLQEETLELASLFQKDTMKRTEPYELDSFYPKARGYITSQYQKGYLRFVTTEEEYIEDEKIDRYGGKELRLVEAHRSRGNKKVAYDGKIAEVTYFHISRARNLLLEVVGDLRGKRVLDMSAGWGDRLVATLQLGGVYVGTDPSSKMKPVYENILQEFSSTDSSVATLPFEDFEVPGKFDVAFSSPPYYDVEIYNDEDTQSIARYPGYETWMQNFLFPCLAKMVLSLLPYGYLILHLGDTKSVPLAEPAIMYLLHTFPSLAYLGVIGVGNEKTSRPVWIFQLQDDVVNKVSYYPSYYPVFCGQKLQHRISSPPDIIREGRYTIYSDHKIVGGSKRRALHYLIQHNSHAKRFLYAGPITGLACVALNEECKYYGKKCVLYLQGKSEDHEKYLKRATIHRNGILAILQDQALKEGRYEDYVLPFGLDNVIFNEHFTTALRIATANIPEPRRCWLACGSGVLLRCLATIWKHTIFCVVTVGRKIFLDTYPDEMADRFIVYHYPEIEGINFLTPTWKLVIPSWTSKEYDGKAYHLMTKYFQEGDVMWNVGR